MRRSFLLLLACLALLVGGCNIAPEEDPGYYVMSDTTAAGTTS